MAEKDGYFYHGENLVIKERNRQTEIISDIHKGIKYSENSRYGITQTKKRNLPNSIREIFLTFNIKR